MSHPALLYQNNILFFCGSSAFVSDITVIVTEMLLQTPLKCAILVLQRNPFSQYSRGKERGYL